VASFPRRRTAVRVSVVRGQASGIRYQKSNNTSHKRKSLFSSQSIQKTCVIARSEATWQSRKVKKDQALSCFAYYCILQRQLPVSPGGRSTFLCGQESGQRNRPGFRRPTGTLHFSSARALALSDDRNQNSGISKSFFGKR